MVVLPYTSSLFLECFLTQARVLHSFKPGKKILTWETQTYSTSSFDKGTFCCYMQPPELWRYSGIFAHDQLHSWTLKSNQEQLQQTIGRSSEHVISGPIAWSKRICMGNSTSAGCQSHPKPIKSWVAMSKFTVRFKDADDLSKYVSMNHMYLIHEKQSSFSISQLFNNLLRLFRPLTTKSNHVIF